MKKHGDAVNAPAASRTRWHNVNIPSRAVHDLFMSPRLSCRCRTRSRHTHERTGRQRCRPHGSCSLRSSSFCISSCTGVMGGMVATAGTSRPVAGTQGTAAGREGTSNEARPMNWNLRSHRVPPRTGTAEGTRATRDADLADLRRRGAPAVRRNPALRGTAAAAAALSAAPLILWRRRTFGSQRPPAVPACSSCFRDWRDQLTHRGTGRAGHRERRHIRR